MQITKITPFLMNAGSPKETAWSAKGMSSGSARHWCFVKIETDEGIHGVGEGSGWPTLVHAAIGDLAPLLIGEDARDIDRLWHKMFTAQMGHGQTGTPGAGGLSAIDMALWDINAKALDVPVWRLLGGRFRDRVRCYAHASSIETGRDAIAMGYGALKTGNVSDAVDKVRAFRAAFGKDVDIAVDLHGPPWLASADAIALARALEPEGLLFLEDPVAPEDVDGWRRVRDATDLPLAAGERTALIWGYQALLERKVVDIIQPDTGRAGGLTQLRKIAALAEAHFVTVAPHAGSLGPVAEFAAVHFLASIPNCNILERFHVDWAGRSEVVTTEIEVADGFAIVPDAPGLGVDIIPEAIASFPPGTNVSAPTANAARAYEPGTGAEHLYFQHRRGRGALFETIESRED